jgi:hypothetical protein
MNAAARAVESVVVAGRGDLIRGGRGREGRGCSNVAPRWSPYPIQPWGSVTAYYGCVGTPAAEASRRGTSPAASIARRALAHCGDLR